MQIHHGKIKFIVANSISPRQIKIYHSKFKFTTEKYKFERANSKGQIQIRHSETKIPKANSNSSSLRQIQIHHVKFKFTKANSNSPGKLKLTTASSNSPRQIQIHCGKLNTANSNTHGENLMRQIKNHHIKFKFTTANSNSLQQFHIHQRKFKFITPK